MMTRIEKLQEIMAEKVDAFYTTCANTRLYLTKFKSSDGTVFVTSKKGYFYVDFRYIEAAEKNAEGVDVIMPKGRVSEYISILIAEEKIRKIGFEDQRVSVAELESLKKTYPEVEFVPMGKTITEMCVIKDQNEIEIIQKAQDIADAAFSELMTVLNPNMTEIEVAAEIEYRMKRHGAIAPSFETIAVSGVNSSKPHGVPENIKLNKGLLTMDFGAYFDGYCSDMTRTVCIGKASEEEKRLYYTVLKAQTTAIAEAKVGMKCAFIDKIARDIINEAGYEGCFGHSLGHGVGLYIHEEPRFSPGAGNTIFSVGHVVTVEPGIYVKGKFGARIEDMIVATKEGVIDITNSPKSELIEIY